MYLPASKVKKLHERYAKGLLNKLYFHFFSMFFDLKYKCVSIASLYVALNNWIKYVLPNLHYKYDFFDCDDYAICFKCYMSKVLNTNGVGIVIGKLYYGNKFIGYHAWNSVLVSQNDLVFVEPQTGEVFIEKTTDGFKYELMYVII